MRREMHMGVVAEIDFRPRNVSWGSFLSGAFLLTLSTLTISGCSTPTRMTAVPYDETVQALPLGLPNARFFPVRQSDDLLREAADSSQRERQALGLAADAQMPHADFLAISGGADDGAFGAGLLAGWGEEGDRPTFQLVTGVSTGALIAPFAFLGSKYDQQLKDMFTTISAKDVFEDRGISGLLFDDAMADTTPLANRIAHFVTPEMMTDLANEYRKGRLLFIGTTDLDAQEPCLWNIGAIAASGRPGALDLIRKVLRASAAVPGAFQPVLFDVSVNGIVHQELHVDGGAIGQLFLYPPNIDLRTQPFRDRRAYLIRNGRQDSEWTEVEPRTMSIAARAISTMIKYSGRGDVSRVYATTQRDGVDYNLADIGPDFVTKESGTFEPAYMKALFDYGYQKALHGYPWKKVPPIIDPAQK